MFAHVTLGAVSSASLFGRELTFDEPSSLLKIRCASPCIIYESICQQGSQLLHFFLIVGINLFPESVPCFHYGSVLEHKALQIFFSIVGVHILIMSSQVGTKISHGPGLEM